MSFLRKIFGFFMGFKGRPGFDKFVGEWIGTAMNIVLSLSTVQNNKDFHLWRDEAFRLLKNQSGELKDTWIAVVVNLAFEELKARKMI